MKSLITCLVAGAGYLIHPQKLGSIEETINPDSIIPVTLLSTNEIFDDLEAQLHFFDSVDDVFVPEFGFVLVEKPGGNETDISTLKLADLGVRELYHLTDIHALDEIKDLPSGPYFLHGPNLHQAWKLYDDTAEAFTFGVIPEDVHKPDQFRALSSLSTDGAVKAVPVPSRLYHSPPNPELPLSGVRISITESLSLNGVYTTLSSRAWSELYMTAAHKSASLVQEILRMGAVIVGKTKTSQLDAGHDWVDTSAPWNPRADSYQTPGGVSAGASTAVSSYNWLEYSIGTDKGDGALRNAALQGLYALRPSRGTITDKHLGNSATLDNTGLSSRHVDMLKEIADAVLDLKCDGSLPQNLIYASGFYSNSSESDETMNKQFVTVIENFLGIKTKPLNLADVWAKSPPKQARGLGLQEYLDEAPFLASCYELYHRYEDFRNDYKEAFEHGPFMEKNIRFQWDMGKRVSKSDYDAYGERLDIFRTWFDSHVMALQKSPDTLMILEMVTEDPIYRGELQRLPTIVRGITPELLPPVLQVPHLIAPFAQLPYESKVTARTEYQPVSGSVIGQPGGDLMLIQVVKRAFELAEWRTLVDTGRLAFPIGDNSRNVGDQHANVVVPLASEPHFQTTQALPDMNEL